MFVCADIIYCTILYIYCLKIERKTNQLQVYGSLISKMYLVFDAFLVKLVFFSDGGKYIAGNWEKVFAITKKRIYFLRFFRGNIVFSKSTNSKLTFCFAKQPRRRQGFLDIL